MLEKIGCLWLSISVSKSLSTLYVYKNSIQSGDSLITLHNNVIFKKKIKFLYIDHVWTTFLDTSIYNCFRYLVPFIFPNKVSKFCSVSFDGVGSEMKICVLLDKIKLLHTVILPKGGMFLFLHVPSA